MERTAAAASVAGDVSASPEQREACNGASQRDTRVASQAFERIHTHESTRGKQRVSAVPIAIIGLTKSHSCHDDIFTNG